MEFREILWALLALFFVLGLIVMISWGMRRFGLPGSTGGIRGSRRIGVVEVAPIDMKRRLVLVRRDDVEHLILLGSQSDVVVERGITGGSTGFDSLVDDSARRGR